MVFKRKGSTHRTLHHPRHNFAPPEDPAPVFVLLSHACPVMVPTLSIYTEDMVKFSKGQSKVRKTKPHCLLGKLSGNPRKC